MTHPIDWKAAFAAPTRMRYCVRRHGQDWDEIDAVIGAYFALSAEARVHSGKFPQLARNHASICRGLIRAFGQRFPAAPENAS